MRKLIVVLFIGLISFTLSSCFKSKHEHTFKDDWVYDTQYHWHEADCGHDVTSSKSEHVLVDGKCDFCNYQQSDNHTHTYSKDWTYDYNYHWHESNCGHDVTSSKSEHVLVDGKCDFCNYQQSDNHTHTYSKDWTYDDNYHWHESNCEHDVIINKTNHKLSNGKCSVCDYTTGNDNNNQNNIKYELNREKYQAKQVSNGQIYDYSIAVDEYAEYYYFYLGTIYDVPIRVSAAVLYGIANYKYKFSFSKEVSQEYSNRKSQAAETITTISNSSSYEYGFTSDVSLSAEIGASDGLISSKVGATLGASHSDKHNTSSSNSVTNGVTWTTEEEETVAEIHKLETAIELYLSEEEGFKRGYTYQMSFYKALDIYAVVEKDKISGTYTYEIQSFFKKNTPTIAVLEESEDGQFDSSEDYTTLSFNLDNAIETIQNIKETSDTVSLNLEKGTEEKPYIIDDEAELNDKFAERPEGVYYKLSNNFKSIDISKLKSIPETLNMHIDFNNATLLNYKEEIIGKAEGNYGIFHTIGKKGSVKNAIIEDCFIKNNGNEMGNVNAGILCAQNEGTIENIIFRNNNIYLDTCEQTDGVVCVSGIVCGTNYGSIKNVRVEYGNSVWVESDSHHKDKNTSSANAIAYVGGITGHNLGSVKDCNVIGSASKKSSFEAYIRHHNFEQSGVSFDVACGGIIGRNDKEQSGNDVDSKYVTIISQETKMSSNSIGSWLLGWREPEIIRLNSGLIFGK